MNSDESGRPSRKSNRTQTQLYHLSKFGMFVNVLIKSFNRVWLIVNIRRVRKVNLQFNLRGKDFNCNILDQIDQFLTFSSLLNLREKQIKKEKKGTGIVLMGSVPAYVIKKSQPLRLFPALTQLQSSWMHSTFQHQLELLTATNS